MRGISAISSTLYATSPSKKFAYITAEHFFCIHTQHCQYFLAKHDQRGHFAYIWITHDLCNFSVFISNTHGGYPFLRRRGGLLSLFTFDISSERASDRSAESINCTYPVRSLHFLACFLMTPFNSTSFKRVQRFLRNWKFGNAPDYKKDRTKASRRTFRFYC